VDQADCAGGPQQSTRLSPVEGLWSSLKGMELANLTSPSLAEVVTQAYRGIDRVGRTPHLAYSFLRHGCQSHDLSTRPQKIP
jgi:hypothetical protein